MSVTTTANPVSHAVLEVLADYDLHHSGNPEHPKPAADPNVRADTAETTDNPEWWPTDHRRIPPYRPVDVNLDRTQRPDGVNPIEVAFIFTMLRGVQLQANLSSIWRRTGGRLNDRIFRCAIGGEW